MYRLHPNSATFYIRDEHNFGLWVGIGNNSPQILRDDCILQADKANFIIISPLFY
jgi:hypothetical protein